MATAGGAFEESVANWDIHNIRRFELEQARAQVVRDEQARRIAAETLGAYEGLASGYQQPLSQLSRAPRPVAAAVASQPLAAVAATSPRGATPTPVRLTAAPSGYINDAQGITARDVTRDEPFAFSSKYSPDDTGKPPGFDTDVTIGVPDASEPVSPAEQQRIEQQSNAATRSIQQEQFAAMARAQIEEESQKAQAEQDARKATPVSSKLMDMVGGGQAPAQAMPGAAPGPAGPSPGAPGAQAGPAAAPMKVQSAPELQAIAQLAPQLGDEKIKETVTALTSQSGLDFNNADRMDRYARAIAKVDPKASISAMESAVDLRQRGWQAEEKALKFAADRFDQIGALAATVETQEDLDRALMIAGARGLDTSQIPRDIARAKPALAQLAKMSLTHKEQIKEVQDNRRLAVDETNAANRAEINYANARLKDAQIAQAQTKTDLAVKKSELDQRKADDKHALDEQKLEQKDYDEQQKKVDDAFKDDEKKARLSLSITNSYMGQSKEFRRLGAGVRSSINYMNDISANHNNTTPDKDFALVQTYINAISDVKSFNAYRTYDDVMSHPSLPARMIESVKRIGVGTVMLDTHRNEMYAATLERFRPLNEDQTLLENATAKRLQDGTGRSDYMITYSLPELTMQSGAGEDSPNAPTAAPQDSSKAPTNPFEVWIDPKAPEADNMAKIMAINDAKEREAVMGNYKKYREEGQRTGKYWPIPSKTILEEVVKHPEQKKEFEQHYGPGSFPQGTR